MHRFHLIGPGCQNQRGGWGKQTLTFNVVKGFIVTAWKPREGFGFEMLRSFMDLNNYGEMKTPTASFTWKQYVYLLPFLLVSVHNRL